MVKIFIGNLPDGGLVKNEDVRPLFETYGAVTECEVIKNYGFVHMDSEAAASTAIQELNGTEMKGRKMKVELSEHKGGRQKNTQKLFVGNIADGTTSQELRSLFETYGEVMEADVINDKNYGFVHVDAGMGRGKIQKIISELNGYDLNGNKLRVQLSTSGVRQQAGMGGESECFRCGGSGHWSRECRFGGSGGYQGGRGGGRGRGRRDAPYPARGGGGYRGERGYSSYSYSGGYGDDYRDYYGGPMRGGDQYYASYSGGSYGEENFAEDDMYTRRPPPARSSRGGYTTAASGYSTGTSAYVAPAAYGAPPPGYDYGTTYTERRNDYGGYAAGSSAYGTGY